MAKNKKINKRCPLANECGRKSCEYVNTELKCDYYKYNARVGFTIPDQEELLKLQEQQLAMKLDEALMQKMDIDNKLVYLPIDVLFPHPNNPRKDLGDLTELANSIKEKGIMQNLTVVPRFIDNTYTVIIGHRRLAAAKAAGLSTVPCVIVEMSNQEQLATMLLENIQRSDLTLYEQAQGFQMMLDFGETVDTISSKTGLSKTTVRRRVKLAELDQNTLKRVSGRQISIGDLDRLSEIEDEQVRNKVLTHIGTNNFENELKKAKDSQKREKERQIIKAELLEMGLTELLSGCDISNYKYHRQIYVLSELEKQWIKEHADVLYFKLGYYYELYSLKSNVESPEKQEEEEKAKKIRELNEIRKNALKDAFERAFSLRYDFIKKFTEAKAKDLAKEISIMQTKALWGSFSNYDYDWDKYMDLMHLAVTDDTEFVYDNVKDVAESLPYKSALVNAYIFFDDSINEISFSYQNVAFKENEMLISLYECLKALGYEMSDEEIELIDGSCPLYIKEIE